MYQGRLDESQLSDVGWCQAEALAERLANHKLVAVYSSPLRRALQTAELLATKHRLAVIARKELTDVDHGEWSGKAHHEVADVWPDLCRQWREEPAAVRFPGGESLPEVRQRALGFLAWVRQRHSDGEIAVITHGEVLQLLLCHFLEMHPNQLWTLPRENCALSVVDDYEVPLVMAINDICHLEGVRSSLHAQAR